ncbi:hypothetical protein BN946_scf184314.g1 [Trametes cinnabarina]|uniref:Uncharacterized protein n=1 Tax=Pycnoporus cinnabarinus TaxID=5643 RepID=A0A060SX00_PYCCI|nr:hypothetical protein BN946_scf184314.g1 [Trametes cinnabarina]
MSSTAPSHTLPFAFARAMSPVIAAQQQAFPKEDPAAVALRVRREAYSKAISITDLIFTIPSNYRDVLAPVVRKTADHAEKLANAQASLRKLESALADGHPPSHLLLKTPELQGCKEFREEGGLETVNNSIRESVQAAQTAVVKAAIAGKKAEVDLLRGRLDNAYLFIAYKDAVTSRFVQVREQNKVPTLKYVDNDGTSVAVNLSTDVTVEGWQTNPAIITEYNDLIIDLTSIAARAIAIINQRESAMQIKIEKKKQVEKSADI